MAEQSDASRQRRRDRSSRDIVGFLTGRRKRLPPLLDVDDVIGAIATIHAAADGCTFNLYFGNLTGTALYAVSVFPERGRVVPGRDLSPDIVRRFVLDNRELLAYPRNNVGTLYTEDDGLSFLDVSTALPGRGEAVRLGERYNQIAVYDLARGETIEIGGTGAPPPHIPPIAERLPRFRGSTQRSRRRRRGK
jgi:hypothetical protein